MTAPLVVSYAPPVADRAGDPVRGRAWTYDSAVTAAARAARGDRAGARALLDALQDLQRADGALEASYDTVTGDGAGPLRSGNQAWVGLAALAWRAETGSRRHERLLSGVATWLLDRCVEDSRSPAWGLVRGGPDVSWISTEHNLEARAFFAALAGVSAEFVSRAREQVARIDAAIDTALLRRDGPHAPCFRQGFEDDAVPLDVQALGMLWLAGQGRRAEAAAMERTADATLAVAERHVAVSGAAGQTFTGYRPFAGPGAPDVLWMEGTLMMRLAKARLGRDVAALDDSADRWAALTAPAHPLQADRAWGSDYHVWPAAAPAAWLALSRSGFALLG